MVDFVNKLKRMNDLFICKFSVSDYINNNFKIYFISPDGEHKYLSVNQIQNADKIYDCVIGNLHLNGKDNSVFEDIETEVFVINRDSYSKFISYYDNNPMWDNNDIGLINKNYGNNLVV